MAGHRVQVEGKPSVPPPPPPSLSITPTPSPLLTERSDAIYKWPLPLVQPDWILPRKVWFLSTKWFRTEIVPQWTAAHWSSGRAAHLRDSDASFHHLHEARWRTKGHVGQEMSGSRTTWRHVRCSPLRDLVTSRFVDLRTASPASVWLWGGKRLPWGVELQILLAGLFSYVARQRRVSPETHLTLTFS